LDEAAKGKLYWSVDWNAKSISFAVEAKTTGWLGFGISTGRGQMIGADIVIGGVTDEGKRYFTVIMFIARRICVRCPLCYQNSMMFTSCMLGLHVTSSAPCLRLESVSSAPFISSIYNMAATPFYFESLGFGWKPSIYNSL